MGRIHTVVGDTRLKRPVNVAAAAGKAIVKLGSGKRTPKQRIVEQRGKLFAPHVMAVPVGFLAARTATPNRFLNYCAKFILVATRSVNSQTVDSVGARPSGIGLYVQPL